MAESKQNSSAVDARKSVAECQPIPALAWYHIDDPDSPVLDELAERFHLHPLQIEDCRHRPQRAKTEEHDEYIFVVLKHLHDDQNVRFDDLDVFFGRDFIVTVSEHDNGIVRKIRQRIVQDKVTRLDRVFYFIVDDIVDLYLPLLDTIAEKTADMETSVLDNPTPPTLRCIFILKRELIDFRRIASGMREVVNALIRREGGMLGDDLDPYFRDVYDHLVRTTDLIETYRDLLSGSLDIYLSAVANRTNEVMKVLTVYGTVALPLVIITGFFGMNLHLPWMQNQHGVWYACGLMSISTLVSLYYFRRKGWF